MPDASVQTFGTHVRWFAPWHFIVMPVLVIQAVIEIVALVRAPSLATAWAALLWVTLLAALVCARWMALRVQDRVVRLEETLRLERLLPGRSQDIEQLTLGQLIGIRFASDAEVPHIVDRILAGELVHRGEVKRAVQHWRADHLRV
jgi:hypothetical protein